MQKQKKNRKGFTLVELMVVVVIIGILTAIAIPVYMSVTDNAKTSACQANQKIIASAILMFVANSSDQSYPTTMAQLDPYMEKTLTSCGVEGCSYDLTGDATHSALDQDLIIEKHKINDTAETTTPTT